MLTSKEGGYPSRPDVITGILEMEEGSARGGQSDVTWKGLVRLLHPGRQRKGAMSYGR